jgi:4'-phosphopantetheinyl transferase
VLEIRFSDSEILRDPALFADAYARVSAARRAKVDRLKADCPRRLSLAAGLLLADTLAGLGVAGAMAEEEEDENGKPFLPRCPELHFSLSHSGTAAMCTLADRPVGCDIQTVTPRSLRLAERFFTPAEQERIFSQSTEEARQEMFYRIWTLKESFIKCIGLGLALPLDSFSVWPEETGEIVLVQDADPGGFRLAEPAGPEGYRCAVCVRE